MRIVRVIGIAIVGLLLATQAGSAGATGQADGAFMVTGGRTSQPIGHYEFCLRYAGECGPTAGPDRVGLTPETWNTLVAVDAKVNRTIKAETDDELYHRPEWWAYPTTAGDCEDLVLEKRRELIQQGWPVGSLLITVVRQRNGDGHAVLTVLTDRGDIVLDNLQPRVLPWNETNYVYVKRQSTTNAGQWMAIDDERTNLVGSVSP